MDIQSHKTLTSCNVVSAKYEKKSILTLSPEDVASVAESTDVAMAQRVLKSIGASCENTGQIDDSRWTSVEPPRITIADGSAVDTYARVLIGFMNGNSQLKESN